MFPNWLRWSTEARVTLDRRPAPCIFFFSSFKFHLVQSKGKQPHCVMRPPDGTASPPVHSFISAPLRQTSDCSLEKVFFRGKEKSNFCRLSTLIIHAGKVHSGIFYILLLSKLDWHTKIDLVLSLLGVERSHINQSSDCILTLCEGLKFDPTLTSAVAASLCNLNQWDSH